MSIEVMKKAVELLNGGYIQAADELLRDAIERATPAQGSNGFDVWWHNEGSQAPNPTDDMYEHCKRMCEIAWANGAYKALEKPAQQKPAVAAYWAVVDWDEKHIQVDQDTMQLEVYETKHHAKANVNSRTKAMLVYISATPPASVKPWIGLDDRDFTAINRTALTKLQAATCAESILKEKNCARPD